MKGNIKSRIRNAILAALVSMHLGVVVRLIAEALNH
jgi:UDP-N-acetylmuramyl pentapeptide synthase